MGVTMSKKQSLAQAQILIVVLILATTLFGGCGMNYRPIENADQAKEYILSELEKKYGEKFSSDVDAEIDYTSEEKGYFHQYILTEIYSDSYPSEVFAAVCSRSKSYVTDTRAALIFKKDAESLINEAFSNTDFLARWEVSLGMFDTAHTWKEGDSFDEFMGEGGMFDPWLKINLYIKQGTSNEEATSQIYHCFHAVYDLGREFEMRAFYEGEENGSDSFFLYNTSANHYVYESEESVLEDIVRGLEVREFEKRYQEQKSAGG
jgi:hypothetical protein